MKNENDEIQHGVSLCARFMTATKKLRSTEIRGIEIKQYKQI